MNIRKYNKVLDEKKLMRMIEAEGDEWACYTSDDVSDNYRQALNNSITYVAYDGEVICGYSRSINDAGFYIYVCDLLVAPDYRGNSIGKALLEFIVKDFPDQTVYVMSDVDKYYQKQGYKKEGSIFEVTKS